MMGGVTMTLRSRMSAAAEMMFVRAYPRNPGKVSDARSDVRVLQGAWRRGIHDNMKTA
jgi:hypothetical protein